MHTRSLSAQSRRSNHRYLASRRPHNAMHSRQLHFEQLEDRQMLSAQAVLPEWVITAGGSFPALDLFGATAVHPSGDVYVTTRFSDTVDFDPGPGKTELTSAGDLDMAVARYTPAGELVWARQIGATEGNIDVSICDR